MRSNALASDSPEIVQAARQYESDSSRNLKNLQNRLRRGTFVFKPTRGILIKKKGKAKKRPIVIAPLESRIVQRALLDVIQKSPQIKRKLGSGHNFGGVSGKGYGVPSAVAEAVKAANSKRYFIRTDIKSFFTQVPRERAITAVLEGVEDPAFRELFTQATHTELDDTQQYDEEDRRLFPLAEAGVAQGSCLSPLLCNILLADFDEEMNKRGIRCIRYIDDFIVFAKDQRSAFAAFTSAKSMLSDLGLAAYDPASTDPDERRKAEKGLVEFGFDFLGCEITPTQVRPTRENCTNLKASVQAIFQDALVALSSKAAKARHDGSPNDLSSALIAASHKIRGWGNTFQFCSDDRLMRTIDAELGRMTLEFYKRFLRLAQRLESEGRLRKALGVFSLVDCKRDDGEGSARTLALAAAAAEADRKKQWATDAPTAKF